MLTCGTEGKTSLWTVIGYTIIHSCHHTHATITHIVYERLVCEYHGVCKIVCVRQSVNYVPGSLSI